MDAKNSKDIEDMGVRKSFQRKTLRLISKKGKYVPFDNETDFQKGLASSAEFFKRFKGQVDLKNKTVLDIGCGLGPTCYYAVLNGAAKVIGVDIRPKDIEFAKSKISEYPNYRDKVEFKLLENLYSAQFDIVLSKDSFEHYQKPEQFMQVLKGYLKPDGKMIIGFSPFWKSPYGAHTWSLSRWPWIHVTFPEYVVLSELRRYLENDNISYENWASGLNKMTVDRYLRIVQENDLEIEYIGFNASSNIKDRYLLSIFNGLRLLPGLKEYFTINVYSIFQIKKK